MNRIFQFCAFLVSFVLCIFLNSGSSQDITAIATVDTTTLSLGDQTKFTIQLELPSEYSVSWPHFDSLGKIEIISRRPVDSITKNAGRLILRHISVITCFDTGNFLIPPIKIGYRKNADTTLLYTQTNTVEIYIKGIAVDTTKEIMDIKPPIEIPFSFLDYIKDNAGYILGGLLIGALFAFYWFYLSKRKKPAPNPKPLNLKPAHEEALENINILENEKLWQKGFIKEFHSRLSDIIRMYIERRFEINALELTTDEIISSLKNLTQEQRMELVRILNLADLVKFAKANPISIENEDSIKSAVGFVNSTRVDHILKSKEESDL